MGEEVPQSVDLWDEIEEAERTVETWPAWQQRYEADVHHLEERGVLRRGSSERGALDPS